MSKFAVEPTIDVDRNNIVLRIAGGPQGPKGDPTASIVIKGIVSTWPPAPSTSSKEGDLWIVPDPVPAGVPAWAAAGHGVFWDGHQWLDAGVIQGSKGDRGEPGPTLNIKGTAFGWEPDNAPRSGDVWILPDPLPAGTPAGFKAGGAAAWDAVAAVWVPLEAIRGPAGHSITVYGPSDAPPIGVPVSKGDVWLNTGNVIRNTSFDPSSITPVPGPQGPQGAAGPSAYEAWKLATNRPTASVQDFIADMKGGKGDKGDKGDAGETLKVEGIVTAEADLPASPPNLTVNVTKDDGHLWVYDPKSAAAKPSGWVDLGKIEGPTGRSAWMNTPLRTVADLPATGTSGEIIYIEDAGHLYGWNDITHAWVDGGKIGSGAIDDGTAQGQIVVWDATNKHWTYGDPRIAGLFDVDVTTAAPTDKQALAWDGAAKKWRPQTAASSVATLTDVDVKTVPPTKGQTLAWDDADSKWKPVTPSAASPIVFLGNGTWDNTAALDGSAPLYGMPAGTTPSPTEYPPIPGDSYINLATGIVTTFTGPVTNKRTGGAITGGGGPLDVIRERLGTLDDVDVTTVAPQNADVLSWHAASSKWRPVAGFATQAYVNLKVEQLSIGLSHSVSVKEIRTAPPTQPDTGVYYLVGVGATGEWAGNDNAVAFYGLTTGGGMEWHFETPDGGQTHLVEDEQANYSWNGTAWVKVAAGVGGPKAVEDLSNVAHAVKADGDILIYSLVAKSWIGAPVYSITDNRYYQKADTYAKGELAGSLYQVGDIKQSILTEPQFRTMLGAEADRWVLADGRDVTSSDYHTLTGNNRVPDLRGAFLRMAGQNAVHVAWNGGTLGQHQDYSTARPSTAFTGTTNNTGGHVHPLRRYLPNQWSDGWEKMMSYVAGGFRTINSGNTTYNENAAPCGQEGWHEHTVAINGGGDSETRPRNYGVNFFIKIKA